MSDLKSFKRGLSRQQIAGLKQLSDSSSDNWWKELLETNDLLLAVRGGYLNAYIKGQSVLRIGFEKQAAEAVQPRLAIHYKYLVKPELENKDPYISFDGRTFDLDPTAIVNTEYKSGLTLPQLIKTAARFAAAEKSGVHKIARKEPKVVDFEIAFTKAGNNGDPSAPRMDLAVLIPSAGGAELAFCEAKCADNGELWNLEKRGQEKWNAAYFPRSTAVVAQIRKYEQFIQNKDNEKGLIDSYVKVCRTLVEISSQSSTRTVDDLIKQVADGRSRLLIHPHVYLLIYDFGRDQRDGRLAKRRKELRDQGLKIIAKGNPGEFQLANDILRAN
ncbi:hypothetical protein IVB08_10010 [Bradyrhizobium sp. 173]|uniref:hypothetical protein n=1 Tax=Bradyrhizobium sp. 173 TaxID=2782644 RepID=UPI001FF8FB47|nr:hypothetical protein [Bradyrhizobium sp. 173]MCK1564292.1 hypothetical protein [Bradyrhizobium sp. 173]